MANEIDSLAFCLKDSSDTPQSVLVFGQDVNALAELAAATADSFSDSCQANGEGVAQDGSVILNHNPVLKLIVIGSLRQVFSMTMRDPCIGAMRMGRMWSRQYRTYRIEQSSYLQITKVFETSSSTTSETGLVDLHMWMLIAICSFSLEEPHYVLNHLCSHVLTTVTCRNNRNLLCNEPST